MTVIELDDYRVNWRPVRMACFYCGHVLHGNAREDEDATTRFECEGCDLAALTITHEPPDGWEHMSDDELAEAGYKGPPYGT